MASGMPPPCGGCGAWPANGAMGGCSCSISSPGWGGGGPRVWLGWGQRGGFHDRQRQVLDQLQCWSGDLVSVGVTRAGHPRHPLDARADQPPLPFPGFPPPMSRVPRRYAIHLLLSSGKEEVVHFATLEAFQQWYTSALHSGASPDSFVNVPISELEGEYLLVRAGSVIGLRVEPLFGTLED